MKITLNKSDRRRIHMRMAKILDDQLDAMEKRELEFGDTYHVKFDFWVSVTFDD